MKTVIPVVTLIIAGGVLINYSIKSTRHLPLNQTLETFLDDPEIVFGNNSISREDFRLNSIAAEHVRISLSNLAEGCANFGLRNRMYYDEAKDCIDSVVVVASDLRLSPYEKPIVEVRDLGNNGLYLSHLNIILGSWKRLTDDDTYAALNQQISEHLARQTLSEPQKNVCSYPTLEYRWPADQTATLYSLWLYDQNYGTTMSEEPIKEWLKYMDGNMVDDKTGLYISEVTGKYLHADKARGCALSWSIRYMAAFAPEKATEQWMLYKEKFKRDYWLFTGFREWQSGYDGPSDVDSGPIIFGNGVAATAFAVGASEAVGDEETFAQLRRTERVIRFFAFVFALFGSEDAKYFNELSNSFLASAIRFNMYSNK